jgi:MFS family permease
MQALISMLRDWWRLARSPRARPYLLITLLADGTFTFVFIVAIQSYLPEQHGVSASWAGYVLAAYGGAKLVSQLFAGRIIDRIGRKRGLLCGLLLILAGQAALMLAAVASAAVFPAAAVYGAGAALLWPSVYALASGSFASEERARLTSAMMLTTGCGMAIALGLGFVLPEGFPYVAATGLAVAVIAVALIFAARSRREEAPEVEQTLAGGSVESVIRDVLQPRRLAFSVIVLLQATAVGALLAVFRSYGRDFLGVSLREEALMLAPAAVVAAGAVAAGGVLSDRLGRGRMLVAGYVVAAPSFLVLANLTATGAVVGTAIAAAAGLGLALPSISATSMDLSHTAGQGTLLSWFMALEGLGHAIGPALGGYVSAAGDVQAVLRVAGVLFAALAVTGTALSLTMAPRAATRGATESEALRVSPVEDGM